jgi:4-amino-4-deoxy-L-arabinose transferase-like glycosyltransferase
VALVQPWSELPLNDDWQYAHMAKSFAERGVLPRDVYVSPTVVGQSVIALPVIRAFGFSHLHLRLLTLLLSAGILIELEYLLVLAGVAAGIRFIALATVVANPIFLDLSMSFMTENYVYFVVFLSACVWYTGRKRESSSLIALAGVIGGLSFWIRQFGALVLPALVIAEWLAGPRTLTSARKIALRRAPAVLAWWTVIALYFAWAKATGSQTYNAGFVENILRPRVGWLLLEVGIWLFYVTVFFAPFIIGSGISRKLTVVALGFFGALGLTAAFAWFLGVKDGAPLASLHSSFPFLTNVFTNYGVGPITLTDVYWGQTQ